MPLKMTDRVETLEMRMATTEDSMRQALEELCHNMQAEFAKLLNRPIPEAQHSHQGDQTVSEFKMKL